MSENRLRQLHALGQSVWLDYIDRKLLNDGSLDRLIRDDSLMGMTSNPTIFEKALSSATEYDAQIAESAAERTAFELFELLETDDVRAACDKFADAYESSGSTDGFVSIEVSPGVANDAGDTAEEAHRLWAKVDRPNLLVKVPGTVEGAKAVRRLIADGVNVNITLLFAVEAHDRVIESYLAGLEDRIALGKSIKQLASVASFFVSRVDTEADKRLDALIAAGGDKQRLEALKGKTAIANAKLAYRLFQQRFSGPRWDALAARGAQLQRPLWASTSTKNPAYRDVMYVEALIGPHTVDTMPPATIDAFRDHGIVARTVDADVAAAERHIAELESVGIRLKDVTEKLLVDGIASFQKSFEAVIAGLEEKTHKLGYELLPSR
ncbi:MAG TPA: transaldolase [Gemmatimonadaceae bacterium]|nr:transaldolase [Gemmatimonadaceae bacterium]